MDKVLLRYRLIKTSRRLTLDIIFQDPSVTWMGEDDGDYYKFTASNGYEVISRSRMDIQTERIWLLGANSLVESRSGSMVFSSDEKRDAAYMQFIKALDEWAEDHSGCAINVETNLGLSPAVKATIASEGHWWVEKRGVQPGTTFISAGYGSNDAGLTVTGNFDTSTAREQLAEAVTALLNWTRIE